MGVREWMSGKGAGRTAYGTGQAAGQGSRSSRLAELGVGRAKREIKAMLTRG